jgi:hypothetical protein
VIGMFGLSPLYAGLVGAGVGALLLGATFWSGAEYQYRKDAVASLKAEISGLKHDLDITRKAKEAAEIVNGDLESDLSKQKDDLDALRKEVAAGAAAGSFSDDELRDILRRFPKR